jgi:hypothetical protein
MDLDLDPATVVRTDWTLDDRMDPYLVAPRTHVVLGKGDVPGETRREEGLASVYWDDQEVHASDVAASASVADIVVGSVLPEACVAGVPGEKGAVCPDPRPDPR